MALVVVWGFISACNNNTQAEIKSTAERRAEEKSKRNPIRKGRYQCAEIMADGKKDVSPLYILSDELYQYQNTVGKYRFDSVSTQIHWISGPFHYPQDEQIGIYKKALDASSTITIRKSGESMDSKSSPVIECTWTEFQY